MDLKNTYEVFLNQENILIARFNQLITDAESNLKQGQMVVDDLLAVARKSPDKKFNILIDLMPLGEASYISEKTRQLYAKALEDKQLRKLAVIGKSPAYREVLSFLVAAIKGESKIRWFNNVKKAITWLKQDK